MKKNKKSKRIQKVLKLMQTGIYRKVDGVFVDGNNSRLKHKKLEFANFDEALN